MSLPGILKPKEVSQEEKVKLFICRFDNSKPKLNVFLLERKERKQPAFTAGAEVPAISGRPASATEG